MKVEIFADKRRPPLAALLTAEFVRPDVQADVCWTDREAGSSLRLSSDAEVFGEVSMCRLLGRLAPQRMLFGSDPLEQAQVDHWLTRTNIDAGKLEEVLTRSSFLLPAAHPTIADFAVLAQLKRTPVSTLGPNTERWLKHLHSMEKVKECVANVERFPIQVQPIKQEKTESRLDRGKFVELPDAKMGEVVVRFPPEASGYLHVGHAKAALLNYHYKVAFNGKLILRFDDTNPDKEREDFEHVILEDVQMLGIKPDVITYTSDSFPVIEEMCVKLLRQGDAYVDDTDAETMKKERETRQESKRRSNSIEENLAMWKQMALGTKLGLKCCVRAKIDMSSNNGCMRDPTIYRCKIATHPRQGDKYKAYPTYDFACPIVDSVEGVTHALRTTEYHDRDEQFYWVIDKLGLRKPLVYEYSRLNLMHTVLSKRKLTYFVEQGLVNGWDDPRMPTVRGVLRRGLTVDGLKEFILAQGSSKSVVMMDWDKLWAFNKKRIEMSSKRFYSVESDGMIEVHIDGLTATNIDVAWHPKDASMGTRQVAVDRVLLVDRTDGEQMKVGDVVTFMSIGNVKITEALKDGKVKAVADLDNKDFKKTLKVSWIAKTAKNVRLVVCYIDNIISKAVLAPDDDFKKYIRKVSMVDVPMLGESNMASIKKGDIIQIQRKGFFICDSVGDTNAEANTGLSSPLTLIYVPDGGKSLAALPAKARQLYEGKLEPSVTLQTAAQTANASARPSGDASTSLWDEVSAQGEKVRKLKAENAAKEAIASEVKVLLALKAKYKTATGADWDPKSKPSPATSIPVMPSSDDKGALKSQADKTVAQTANATARPSGDASTSLWDEVSAQGDKVRKLKAENAAKEAIASEVKVLLALKAKYKTATGADWDPKSKPSPATSIPVMPSSDDKGALWDTVKSQADKVDGMRLANASEDAVKAEFEVLLKLKAEFVHATGSEWKSEERLSGPWKAAQLDRLIRLQGDNVRQLKAAKTSKEALSDQVNRLLTLKAEFKTITGSDWNPNVSISSAAPALDDTALRQEKLWNDIARQGDKVRQLKAEKATKDVVQAEVQSLLALKAQYKELTGNDWKPTTLATNSGSNRDSNVSGIGAGGPQQQRSRELSTTSAEEVSARNDMCEGDTVEAQIKAQGERIRTLKASKTSKEDLQPEIDKLLALKAKYKQMTGKEYVAEGAAMPRTSSQAKSAGGPKPNKKPQTPAPAPATKEDGSKKQTRLGLEAKKEENLADWYSQIITKAEMIEYYDVSGCYILRPWAYGIWQRIQQFFDAKIQKLGVENCYFPMFVSRQALEREKAHIADFSPEVAWVTKSGSSDMAEPIAIRPTSETVMYPSYAKWIKSHRDLPLKLNQWCNVVRWEFKNPQPFLRTREFLWQEGHTAFANTAEAIEEVHEILGYYADVYEKLLAIPVIRGKKTEKEKFAGGCFTTTVEAYVPASGRGIQGATSHHLGQNFSKMFEIVYEDPETREKQYVYQNSWGITTRTIGVMVMVHGDNQGLVVPPKVAHYQVVVIPCGITVSLPEADKRKVIDRCQQLADELQKKGIRLHLDSRDNYSPGWKFNHWELKGVPVRIEVGPKDVASCQFVAVRRDTMAKHTFKTVDQVEQLLDTVQADMFSKAKRSLDERLRTVESFDDFLRCLEEKCIIFAPFCGQEDCEDEIKKLSTREESEPGAPSMGAKSLCIPFEQPKQLTNEAKCVRPSCTNRPQFYTLFGRSY